MQILSGVVSYDEGDAKWTLDTSNPAARTVLHTVDFLPPFEDAPDVVVAINKFEFPEQTAQKFSVSVHERFATYCVLAFHAWDGSIVESAGASWIAYGDAGDEDEELEATETMGE